MIKNNNVHARPVGRARGRHHIQEHAHCGSLSSVCFRAGLLHVFGRTDGRTDCTVLTLYFPLQKHPQTSHGTIHLCGLVPLLSLQDLAIGGNQKTLRQQYKQSNDINQAVATVVAVMNTYVTFKHCLSVLQ
jgi:hypothetical protein